MPLEAHHNVPAMLQNVTEPRKIDLPWASRFPCCLCQRAGDSFRGRSPSPSLSISPVEIKSVRAKPYALGVVDVVHQNGRVHLLSQMDGFHDFISTIKSLNPEVKIEGC